MTLLGMPGFGLFGILVLVILFLLIPLIALVDVLMNEFTGSNKIIWVVLILFLPFLGAILYFLVGTKQKIRR
ncbi:MAG: PLD nuclease N-terminal domain-containing protein [Bacteroidales bacterium]|nr:PLD nuclease N-terminal domain-containing protein [Bacteroidales bacterium]MDT8431914.1 PLD nuclease N-terminal domain-containing protein [Bacteroidales bacterium]